MFHYEVFMATRVTGPRLNIYIRIVDSTNLTSRVYLTKDGRSDSRAISKSMACLTILPTSSGLASWLRLQLINMVEQAGETHVGALSNRTSGAIGRR